MNKNKNNKQPIISKFFPTAARIAVGAVLRDTITWIWEAIKFVL